MEAMLSFMKVEPLPQATVGQIIGLLEVLSDYRSKQEDLHELAQELQMDLDEFSPIVEATEILGFAEIVNGDIKLTSLGQQFVNADINERKLIFKDRLKRIKLFKELLKLLRKEELHSLDREIFVDELSTHLPPESADRVLRVAIDWGRFAELIGYSADAEEVYIDAE
jgi:NitT/TauT family transport system ATP-binding protein